MIEELEYLEPSSPREAAALLSHYGEEAKAMAGGQTLIPMLRQRLLAPRYVVSLLGIEEMKPIQKDGQGNLLIGACATHRAVESSPLVRSGWPLLAETVGWVSAPQIRNLGTLGGDLCHSDYGADPPASLLALGAQVQLVGPSSQRWLPLEEFFVDLFETALRPDEVLAQVQVPAVPLGAVMVYIKYCLRAMDPAIVGVAALLVLENGLCREARIGLNGASPVSFRAHQAEEALRGRPLDAAALEEAARLAQDQARPISDAHAPAEYRKRMVGVFVKRALRAAQEKYRP